MSRFVGIATCEACFLSAAGYTPEEIGYTPDRTPLSLVAGWCIPEGDLSDFGTAACEGCGSTLAGARHAVTVDQQQVRAGATAGQVCPGAITDPALGALASTGEVFTNQTGTYVAGHFGPHQTFANLPLTR